MSHGFFTRLWPRVVAFGSRVQKPARFVLLPLVVWKLWSALNAIGWGAMVRNLPVQPWFYVIFLINYLTLSFYETIIYHWLWHTGPSVLPALLRKRVYNDTVLEYSGETALFVWASEHTHIPEGQVFRNVRDVNILSALLANLVTFLLLVAVIVGLPDALGVHNTMLLRRGLMMSGGIVLLLVVLAVVFRKRFLALSPGKIAGISGLHTLRLLTCMGLQALQWHVAVPQLGWQTWVLFTGLQMAVSRIPLLPAKDLFFAGLAISLVRPLHLDGQITPAIIAGLFVGSSGLSLLVNGGMYVVGHMFKLKVPPHPHMPPKESLTAKPGE